VVEDVFGLAGTRRSWAGPLYNERRSGMGRVNWARGESCHDWEIKSTKKAVQETERRPQIKKSRGPHKKERGKQCRILGI